jgi:hypothetical protein
LNPSQKPGNFRLWHDLAVQIGANERQVSTFPVNNVHNCNVRFRGTAESAWMAGMGAILPVKQHGEHLLSGIAQ